MNLTVVPELQAPSCLYLTITSECNLRCKMCHLWTTKDSSTVLTTEEKLQAIEQFHQLNPGGAVILCGGETMLRGDQFWQLSKACRSLGLACTASTNGTFIQDDNLADLLRFGPTRLVLSMDGHRAELHDFTRGVKGSWDQLISTIEKVLRKRDQLGDVVTELRLLTLLYRDNFNYWPDIVEFARTLNVDSIAFQMLTPTYVNQNPKRDVFFESQHLENTPETIELIDHVESQYVDDPFVEHDEDCFSSFRSYIRGQETTDIQVCESHHKNMMISTEGDVSLCFNMSAINDAGNVGNIRERSLSDLWFDQYTATMREKMDDCRLSCGMLRCHRRVQDVTLMAD